MGYTDSLERGHPQVGQDRVLRVSGLPLQFEGFKEGESVQQLVQTRIQDTVIIVADA